MNVAPFLSASEYRCRHCLALPPDYAENKSFFSQFFEYWVDIRERFGLPIIINSGYRCPVHNRDVGGEECSAHCTGLALDIRPSDGDLSRLVRIIDAYANDLRMKVYSRFVHIDASFLCVPRLRENWVRGYRWWL